MPVKRGRSRSRVSRVRALVTSRRTGNYKRLGSAWKTRKMARLSKQVRRITKTIETKECQWKTAVNVPIEHNNVEVLVKGDGGPLNPFQTALGTDDPMAANTGSRIGDEITVKGLKIRGFFEGALNRSKVHFRLMLIKCAKGDTLNRANLFQGKSDNKMIDMFNTERFTVIWQKSFNVTPPNSTAQTANAAGETADARIGITGNRVIDAWIPGRKFGRDGIVKFENSSTSQVKFFDYRLVCMAYDWYGTPQDVNTVGRINELYTVCYFKDA